MTPKSGDRLSAFHFELFRTLIEQRAGLHYADEKRHNLRGHLVARMKATNCPNFEEYYRHLTESPDAASEMQELLNLLTIHETHFFRNYPQFQALRQQVLPSLVERTGERKRLRMWSAGCSSGEEPHSLAMTILEVIPDPGRWDLKVIGTDLSTDILERARLGRYRRKAVERLDPALVERYFQPEDGGYTVRQQVREMVEFIPHNLVDHAMPLSLIEGVEVVFCRNVLIYFSGERMKKVLDRLYESLVPGGYLFLGHSESLWKVSDQFELVNFSDAFAYRKPEPRARRSVPVNPLPPPPVDEVAVEEAKPEAEPEVVAPEASAVDAEELAAAPQTQGTDAMAEAQQAIAVGDDARALELLGRIVSDDVLQAEAYFLVGTIEHRQGNLSQAEKAFRKALYADSSCTLAHLHLASIYERNGSVSDAIREYRNACHSALDGISAAWEPFLEGFTAESLVRLCSKRLEGLANRRCAG